MLRVSELRKSLESITIRRSEWLFSDARINIPPLSFGSDAVNRHTQYSNAVARFQSADYFGRGMCFTLGEGNQFICEAADFTISQFDGMTVEEILERSAGLAESLSNPNQLRWLSPNSGVPLMAAGLIVNTLLDAAARRMGLPSWKFLALLDTDFLLRLVAVKQFPKVVRDSFEATLRNSEAMVGKRILELENSGLPVYFTTWIGHSAREIAAQIKSEGKKRGISKFKIKISPDVSRDFSKLQEISELIGKGFHVSVDANQSLTLEGAAEWMELLSSIGVQWLEEPFAPDNVTLFRELALLRNQNGWSCEIATGENCPNPHTAAEMMTAGIDIFQADPCRMFGLLDGITTSILAKVSGVKYIPHAGGAGLDELSPHLQLFNLARVDTAKDPSSSLTETIGFCSHLFENAVEVHDGELTPPSKPGSGVFFIDSIEKDLFSYREGTKWLEL